MDDATIRSAMVIMTIVLSITPGLLFFWFLRRIWIRVFFWLCRDTRFWVRFIKGGLCLFSGLMLSVIIGVFYQDAWMPGAHLLCDGQVDVASQDFSYKPGQQGTNLSLICTDAEGQQVRITLASIFLSALLYGVALFVLLELIGLMTRTFWRNALTGKVEATMAPPRPPGTAGFVEKILQRAHAAKQASASASKQGFRTADVSVTVNGRPIDSGAGDLVERLQKLKQLREADLIDQSEYDVKRQELLDSL